MNRSWLVSRPTMSAFRRPMNSSLKLGTSVRLWLVSLAICLPVAIHAHDVIVEQVVRIEARLDGGLRLRLQIPLTVVSDAGLPVTPDGRLSPEATSALLQPVGSQVLRKLDLRDEDPLRPETQSVTASEDGRALTVDALYRVNDLNGLSANLNAFQSQRLTPAVTEVVVNRPDGRTNHLRVSGPPTRVLLDPDTGNVAAQFAAHAARLTLRWGDGMLMLLCLLCVPITVKAAVTRVGALVAGQAVGVLLYPLAGQLLVTLSPFPAVVAASIVVIGALYVLFGSRESIVLALAAAVGVLHGSSLAGAFLEQVPNSGGHSIVAVLAFFGFALVAYVWVTALVLALRGWLSGVVRSERVIAYAVAIFAVHSALHHMSEAGSAVSSDAYMTTHSISLVTLGWLLVILIAAAAMSRGRDSLSTGSGARS